MQTTITAGAERRIPDVLRFNPDGSLTVQTIDGHSVRIDYPGLVALQALYDVSTRWFVHVGTDGRAAVHAFRASDEFAVHPSRLVDLLAPSGPDFVYKPKDGNPLNIASDNMRLVWMRDIPRSIDGKKARPRRRETIRDIERDLAFVPLSGGKGHAILDLPDYDRLIKEQRVSDQWIWNERTGQPGNVRTHTGRPGESRSLLSVANEITQPGRNRQVEYRDRNRRNLQRANLRLVPRTGSRIASNIEVDIHVPDNDRS